MFPDRGLGMKEPKTMREIHKIREELHEEWKGMPRKDVIKSVNMVGMDFEKRRSLIKPLTYKIPSGLSGRIRDILEPKEMREIHKIREKYYKETKDLSAKERVALTHRIVKKVLKERNMPHLLVRDEEVKALKRRKG